MHHKICRIDGPLPGVNFTFLILTCCLILFIVSCSSKEGSESAPRFNHVMLYVSDLDRSIDFYEQAFGVSVDERIQTLEVKTDSTTPDTIRVNMAFLKLPGSDFVFELSEQSFADSLQSSTYFQHLGMEVKNIQDAVKRALAAGAEQVTGIRTVSANDVTAKNIFFHGPDGELIELMEILEGEF